MAAQMAWGLRVRDASLCAGGRLPLTGLISQGDRMRPGSVLASEFVPPRSAMCALAVPKMAFRGPPTNLQECDDFAFLFMAAVYLWQVIEVFPSVVLFSFRCMCFCKKRSWIYGTR